MLAVARSFAIEAENGARDGLRLSGLDPAAIFLGKAAAIAVQLASCSKRCWPSASSCCSTSPSARSGRSLLATVAATVGLAAAGTLYGVLAAGLRVRETLVPVLLLPVVSPVLLGATRAWEAAIDGVPATRGRGSASSPCSPCSSVGTGMLAFGPLLEEA